MCHYYISKVVKPDRPSLIKKLEHAMRLVRSYSVIRILHDRLKIEKFGWFEREQIKLVKYGS